MLGAENGQKHKWYQTDWGVFLLVVAIFPVGLYLMWRKTNWSPKLKKVITGVIALLVVIELVTYDYSSTGYGEGINNAQEKVAARRLLPTSTPSVTPTSVPVEKLNIQVSSQIVKK